MKWSFAIIFKVVGTLKNTSKVNNPKQLRYIDWDLKCSFLLFVNHATSHFFLKYGVLNRNVNFPEIIAKNGIEIDFLIKINNDFWFDLYYKYDFNTVLSCKYVVNIEVNV